MNRQVYDESCALSSAAALGADGAAVQFNDVQDDRQTQAQPAMFSCTAAVGLTKAVEHMRQKLRIDTLAGVADDELDGRALKRQLDLDGSSRGREFERVG